MIVTLHGGLLTPCAPSKTPFQPALGRRAASARPGAACSSRLISNRTAAGPQQRSSVPATDVMHDESAEHLTAGRRSMLSAGAAAVALAATCPAAALVEGYTPMTALKGKDYGKSRMSYGDYVTTDSGLQYFDLREGQGASPGPGSTCTVDWDGFTIGYYGRPFEARNKTKGGAFTGDDKEFLRVKLGSGQVIPAFEEALNGMKVGGVRRIIVPEELGYPNGDSNKVGPTPTTFSGRRALEFVLQNKGLIDKTLLFDVELLRVD